MNKKRQPKKLGLIIESILSDRGYLVNCLEAEVIQKWQSIVGERIAGVTECNDVNDGIVYVKVSSSAWRQEISYLKGEIIHKIREKTHCKSIKDIKFY